MANRILLGQRGSEFGLWVSKPGKDVTTAGINDLLFSSSNSTYKYTQILARGSHTFPTTAGSIKTITVTMNNNKAPYVFWYASPSPSTFIPVTILTSYVEVSYSFPSTNQCTVQFYKYGSSEFDIYYLIANAEIT